MSARKRLQDDDILRAIQEWRGNVTAAAERLAIAPINLRKRLLALGVDLPLLRRLKGTGIHGIYRNVPMNQHGTSRPERKLNEPGIWSRRAGPASLASVTTDVLAAARPKPPSPIRLTPEQVERLRDAKFEIQYRLRAEVSESEILQQLFADVFDDWLQRKLTEAGKTEAKVQP